MQVVNLAKHEYVLCLFRVFKSGGKFYLTSLTIDRGLSRRFIRHLEKQNEFTEAYSSAEVISTFNGQTTTLHHETIGSIMFLWGEK